MSAISSSPFSQESSEISDEISLHRESLNEMLNWQVITPLSSPSGLLTPNTLSGLGALSNQSDPSSFVTPTPLPGAGKRSRVTNEEVLKLPLELGWRRETRIRSVAGRLQGEVAYFAPCGKILRRYHYVTKYLLQNGITEISRDNFSFIPKMKIGAFYEAREGPEGPEWILLAEEEITAFIIAMNARPSRRLEAEHQPSGDGAGGQRLNNHSLNVGENNFQDLSDARVRRKLKAQEMARLLAQSKLIRKQEAQAMAQAAKEARQQEAIRLAEETRIKKELNKLLDQQRRIERIQQMQMEKEHRSKKTLEAKRQKQQEAANARQLEAEKRKKEKEMERMRAVMLKQQELERHRIDMVWGMLETERRKQQMILMKAEELRKKAEEKERLKQQQMEEKRINKERKLQLRRLEMEKAKALKKPNEDMCLADLKSLPVLSQIPGLVLQGSTLSDCLKVLKFLHSFGKVLGLHNLNNLDLSVLQNGLLYTGGSMGKVQDLLVRLISSAIQDPGLPAGHMSKTCLGQNLTDVEINRDNVSEILQIYMEAHYDQTKSAALALSLRTKAFQAHSPSQKASMLLFLCDDLCCSEAVISENMDHMTNLWKKKKAVEGKLHKLKVADSSVGGNDSLPFDDDGEEYEGKTGAKAEICEEEDDCVNSASVEELEKQIEKLCMQQSQITQELLHSSHSQRSMMIGQDRYKRRYWLLRDCGGIFVEGMESSEGYEELKEKQETAQVIRIKKKQLKEMEWVLCPTPESQKGKDDLKIFLKGVVKKDRSFNTHSDKHQNSSSAKILSTASNPSHPSSQTGISHSPPPATTLQGPAGETDTSGPYTLCSPQLKGSPWITSSPKPDLQLTNNTVNKLENPEALCDRPPCALFPAVEAAKDYLTPQPIPKEMLHGWWRVSDVQELHSLVEALHSRGIREKVLKKQLQEHMEYLTQLYANSEYAFDVAKLEKQEVREKSVASWCVEEQAMEVDIRLLQQVEALERRVVFAGLQIKGWMHPKPQSKREDLVYREDKLLSSPAPENTWQRGTRRPNNPLDIAVMRLSELEENIDRSREEEVTPGMSLWHEALEEVRSSAQLSLCIQQLKKSIDWDRPVKKVHCHRCRKGDNDELLLLCHGCDKGCHTYCNRPKIPTVSDGKWFCHICVAKKNAQLLRSQKHQNRPLGGGKRGREEHDSPGPCAKRAKLA
ncbi:bromodomain adjacent to zinc finger domain protein 2B [Pleuronectes platessa]|uniref:bromodomain adjacent to zinc finger domain protein 2B n=1 Tax=Pleuronectes platessa TaxID=8262 RepID=UPI00232A57C1|nr:bromodomain adjacent to zinc finger domain protein 2B [Pleuronectes platessa]